jgi:imidazolonepropionase-like amidohydrolase
VLSEEESVGAPQYSLEEMKALVDEAHMWGRKVAAHAHGTEGINRAVLAGVNSIEHGSVMDAADFATDETKRHLLCSDNLRRRLCNPGVCLKKDSLKKF